MCELLVQSLIGPVKQSADVTSVMSAQEQTNSDLSDMLVLNICWCSFDRKVFVFNVFTCSSWDGVSCSPRAWPSSLLMSAGEPVFPAGVSSLQRSWSWSSQSTLLLMSAQEHVATKPLSSHTRWTNSILSLLVQDNLSFGWKDFCLTNVEKPFDSHSVILGVV